MFLASALRGRSRIRHLVFISLFVTAAQFSFSQPHHNGIRINNFGQVNENYYRGAQPDASDFLALKKMGVKTIIDLQKDGLPQEPSWVGNAGMRYYRIPLSSTRPATAEQTEYFLKLVNDPANWPVYVHCAGERHRTGAMTAIYRITKDSWTADRAFDEMKKYGYYSFPNHGSLKKFVYKYFLEYQNTAQKEKVHAPSPESTPAAGLLPAPNAN